MSLNVHAMFGGSTNEGAPQGVCRSIPLPSTKIKTKTRRTKTKLCHFALCCLSALCLCLQLGLRLWASQEKRSYTGKEAADQTSAHSSKRVASSARALRVTQWGALHA